MKRSIKAIFSAASVVLAFGLLPGIAGAQAVITDGSGVYLGVNAEGHLNVTVDNEGNNINVAVNSGATGLAFDTGSWGGPRDATSPGCLCEGWGVSASGSSMYASVDTGPVTNVTVDSFASTASTATSAVSMTSMPGLTVTHQYQPSVTGGVFEAIVTITNSTGGMVTDVRYTRSMDWDVPLTEFNEFVTIGGTGTTANLLYSDNNGFQTPDPLLARFGIFSGVCAAGDASIPTSDFEDCGPADHGAHFDFGFGDLDDGESIVFSIFYGAALTEAAADAALAAIGAELFSYGQSSPPSGDPGAGSPATYIFAFAGVGGEPVIRDVAEPSTLMLLGLGLFGLGMARRRRVA